MVLWRPLGTPNMMSPMQGGVCKPGENPQQLIRGCGMNDGFVVLALGDARAFGNVAQHGSPFRLMEMHNRMDVALNKHVEDMARLANGIKLVL